MAGATTLGGSTTQFSDNESQYSAREWEERRRQEREARKKAAHAKLLERAGLDPTDATRLPRYGAADAIKIPSNSHYHYKAILEAHPWNKRTFEWKKPKKKKPVFHEAKARFTKQYETDYEREQAKKLPPGCTRRDEVICLVRDVPIAKVSESQHPLEIGDEPRPGAVPGSWTNPRRNTNSKGAEDFFHYRGEWRRGKMSGTGTYTFALGGTYHGHWRENRQSGFGKTEYSNGVKYEGEWEGGKWQGTGTLTYPNGTKYHGNFKDGHREGYGKLTYPNGQVYEGDFADGLQHGRGTMVNMLGHKYVGSWIKGQIAGSGSFYLPDGERIVRFWPSRTFQETIFDIREEKRLEEEEHKAHLEALMKPIREKMLEEYVADVRWNIEEQERIREEEEAEEMRRMLLEKREKMKQAKIDALEADMAAREAAKAEA
mmetsp:Transcript_19358/g.68495  ORF Transcript_19358/g.68495 Transcript_19358/m.68495 type:complete len:430 (+) Transcript_19358:279-1568(+)